MPNKDTLLTLTERSYDEYNQVLAEIKKQLGTARTKVFEKSLKDLLPQMTGRQAFRRAILVAMGEETPVTSNHDNRRDSKQQRADRAATK